ncbi:MAG: lipopolysaccharide biosynthesis protein [Clostridiaceae bacterium]|nr:lipopolysaccharide biosynthesis protein [Clostridiaceae bacterium]
MDINQLNNKVGIAAKWSVITEIAAKFVTPITTMILARLLTPEAFGVVATVTMIVSFTEMFADAGFQKYLVQHEFTDNKHKNDSTNVAFWTNLTIALLIWVIIIVFREPLAVMVGNPGLGLVIAVACIQLPITSFSSIQMALYRRSFDFKTLFFIRLIAICIPFVVTIPLAIMGWSYWSIIIGTICGAIVNAVVLTVKSEWKPQRFYSFSLLKEMISFSVWSLIEAISIWFSVWIDIFIIGSVLSIYYLGLYRTSLSMVNGILGIITGATTPVLFAALSRLQNDENAFNTMFFRMQKIVAYLVLPMGVGIYLYSDIATQIFLGSQWTEASAIIGIWALTSAIMIILGNYCSEVYRSKGKPRLSFLAQVLHLIVLVPTCIISLKYGFWVLVYARALIRLQFIIVHLIIMKYAINFPVVEMFTNIRNPLVFTVLMCVLALGLQQISPGIIWSLVSILLCTAFYFGLLGFFAREDVKPIVDIFIRKKAVE